MFGNLFHFGRSEGDPAAKELQDKREKSIVQKAAWDASGGILPPEGARELPPVSTDSHATALELAGEINERIKLSLAELSRDESGVLGFMAHALMAKGEARLIVRKLYMEMPFSAMDTVDLPTVQSSLRQLEKRGLVAIEPHPEMPAVDSTRLTQKALEVLKYLPYEPLPSLTVHSSSLSFSPVVADTMRKLFVPERQLIPSHYGEVQMSTGETAWCGTRLAMSANVADIFRTSNGNLAILVDHPSTEKGPILIEDAGETTSMSQTPVNMVARDLLHVSPDRGSLLINWPDSYEVLMQKGAKRQRQYTISREDMPFIKEPQLLNDGRIVAITSGYEERNSKIYKAKSEDLDVFDQSGIVARISQSELARILPKGKGRQGFSPILSGACERNATVYALISRANGEKAQAGLISIRNGKASLIANFEAGAYAHGEFSPDGSAVAVAEYDYEANKAYIKYVRTDEADTRQLRFPLPEGASSSYLAFSPSGNRLACTFGVKGTHSGGCGVIVWDLSKNKVQELVHFVRSNQSFDNRIEFISEDRVIFCDHLIADYDPARVPAVYFNELVLHAEPSEYESTLARRDAALFEAISSQIAFPLRGRVHPTAEKFRHQFNSGVSCCIVSPNGGGCTVATEKGDIFEVSPDPLGSIYTLTPIAKLPMEVDPADSPRDQISFREVDDLLMHKMGREKITPKHISWEPNKTRLLCLDSSGKLIVIDFSAPESEEYPDRSATTTAALVRSPILEHDNEGLVYADWGAAPNSIVTIDRSGRVSILDADLIGTDKAETNNFRIKQQRYCISATLTPDRRHLITSSNGAVISSARIFSTDNKVDLRVIQDRARAACKSMEISSDGKFLLAERFLIALQSGFRAGSSEPVMAIPNAKFGYGVSATFSPQTDSLAVIAPEDHKLSVRVFSITEKDRHGRPLPVASHEMAGTTGVARYLDGGSKLALGTSEGEFVILGE